MDREAKLARLLEHPAIWRGRSAAHQQGGLPTGFAALDAYLPGYGWPRTCLIEILVSRFGSGELYLLLPALAALTRRSEERRVGKECRSRWSGAEYKKKCESVAFGVT